MTVVNTVPPAFNMVPGSTARVIKVPPDGAVSTVSCRSSLALRQGRLRLFKAAGLGNFLRAVTGAILTQFILRRF